MTPKNFQLALDAAEPGDQIVYFSGHLMRTRQTRIKRDEDRRLGDLTPMARYADKIGNAAWAAYEAGKGVPVQRRKGTGFEYLFVVS